MESIKTEGYKENEEVKTFPDLDIVVDRFKNTGQAKAKEQVWMYESIARNWSIGKSVIDIGCGIGWGTNILGREAIGAYGLDLNLQSINWAKQMYESPTIKFDELDLTKPLNKVDGRVIDRMFEPTKRPLATFDVVCAIEVIEHITDYDLAIESIKIFGEPKRNTVYWISSPNRNNDRLKQDGPRNVNHVREWTAGEFYEVLTQHFQSVVLYGVNSWNWFEENNAVDGNSKTTPIIAKCEDPIRKEYPNV